MDPIINPWLIYLAGLGDSLIVLFVVFAIIAFVIALTMLSEYLSTIDEQSGRWAIKNLKIAVVVCVMASVLAAITPSTRTAYMMIASQYITPDSVSNVQTVLQSIVSAIKEVQ